MPGVTADIVSAHRDPDAMKPAGEAMSKHRSPGWKKILARLVWRGPGRRTRVRKAGRSLGLEELEDRTVLATFDIQDGVATYMAKRDIENNLTLSQEGSSLVLTD